MSFISLFRTQIRTLIIPVYKGPFDYKRSHTKAYKYPFGINRRVLEEEMQEVNDIRQKDITSVSPFHMVWRFKSMTAIPWYQKIVLRRLGLHQRTNNDRVILPNTPHFNQLLWEIKHLIQLKPVSFPDGIPTETDIGSVKVNTSNGVMNVNESFRVSQDRIENAKSHDIFYGKYLREYLKWSSGMFGKTLPHSDILQFDGNHIKEFKQKTLNANKHQHYLYQNIN